jgi:uncharacterized membrane protein YqiK
MTVMIGDQDKFSEQVRDRCSQEMESFGLVIDSFQIQSIASGSNYVANLAIPHQATVEQRARIARANAEREAIEQEQAAQAKIALAVRDTQIQPPRGRPWSRRRRRSRNSTRSRRSSSFR